MSLKVISIINLDYVAVLACVPHVMTKVMIS